VHISVQANQVASWHDDRTRLTWHGRQKLHSGLNHVGLVLGLMYNQEVYSTCPAKTRTPTPHPSLTICNFWQF